MEHSAQADFHGGLGRKGAWRLPFVFYTCAQNFRQKKHPRAQSARGGLHLNYYRLI